MKSPKEIKLNQDTKNEIRRVIDKRQVELQRRLAEKNHRTILNIDDMGGQFKFLIEKGVSVRTISFALAHLLKDLVDADLTNADTFIKDIMKDYVRLGGKYDKPGDVK